ncbi:MAG: DUF4199 domain-containing protein [Alistipes sp.]|nr:DUF4199 domain-containing protein [Alistipes sp.]
MNNRGFWNDVLRCGAILGIVMGASGIFETYALISDSHLMGVLVLEMIVVLVVFVGLLYAFARKRSKAYEPQEGFSYAQALLYTICMSAAAGVIAAVMKYVFVSIIGYDVLVAGYMDTLEYYRATMVQASMPDMYVKMLDDMIEAVRISERPSILHTVFDSFETYAIGGTILGLVISGIVRRDPVITHNGE